MLTLARNFVETIRERSVQQYRGQLQVMGIAGKRQDDLAAGFDDGMVCLLRHLIAAELVVMEEPDAAGTR